MATDGAGFGPLVPSASSSSAQPHTLSTGASFGQARDEKYVSRATVWPHDLNALVRSTPSSRPLRPATECAPRHGRS